MSDLARLPDAGALWSEDDEVDVVEVDVDGTARAARTRYIGATAAAVVIVVGVAVVLIGFSSRSGIHHGGPLSLGDPSETSVVLPEGQDWATFGILFPSDAADGDIEILGIEAVDAIGLHAIEMATTDPGSVTIGTEIGWPPVGVGALVPVDQTVIHARAARPPYLLVGLNPQTGRSGSVQAFTIRYRYHGLVYEDTLPAALFVSSA
jgi:hypothetical protein